MKNLTNEELLNLYTTIAKFIDSLEKQKVGDAK